MRLTSTGPLDDTPGGVRRELAYVAEVALRPLPAVLFVVAALPGCDGGQRDSAVSPAPTVSVADADGGRGAIASERVPGTTDRVWPQVAQTCRRAAARVGIRVLCPEIVPEGRVERALGFGPITIAGERRYYELTFNNASGNHWVVGRGGRREVSRFVFGSGGRSRLVRRDKLGGQGVSTYTFAGYPVGGLHGGHVAVFAGHRGTIVFASVHGHRRRRVALSVLRSMLPPHRTSAAGSR